MATPQTIEFRDPAGRIELAPKAALASLPTPAGAGELRDLDGEKMILNMGPSHPATHGVLRIILELDGEIITRRRRTWVICIVGTKRSRRT